ncbi:ribosome small subunit-dependent GTPase A [Tuwongella immobilis]|uniref:Small ribosomal subunit biogenesis GTPase RsgA n=1 Tax=Tuwongella immobilis TaxID=692036 RepID=A0A6C2YLK7_9BACT|nr:ribosome small subunit-dependent GTPase A [Tuwongella immobilis]VIP02264.1 ribosome small subunit-dependent gtpase a : Putative ribosome biogenesis GTPase RsgA OS=uncultured planctomycete GN=rsgA PE=3 SV=1: DUF258 [Tuwongella immobilis]VTS00879.1 ribosome small subunit-dependent gtpase a : Putative ribosome biogenesis GTPase RsgA OS=uncultured planctomycete GN=rsgA PE=3 SV=1: DUF258 [Tuwongella immobilis]
MSNKKKVRVELRKNRTRPPRPKGWTRDYSGGEFNEDAIVNDERVRSKGELSRHRTIIQEDQSGGKPGEIPTQDMPSVDTEACQFGRVIRVHGLYSMVQTADGREVRCAVRRLLKSLITDERNIVTTGDRVWFRPTGTDEGFIERVEPRSGVLTRASRRREHVLVANVDQLLIVISLVQPSLKPHLIDRYIAAAEQGGLKPILCLNKADLADRTELQPLIGSYTQLGIPVVLTSATTGSGIDQLRELLTDRATVFSGQSGVGKTSLLNAVQPGMALRVKSVSNVNQKGRHTTTYAQLVAMEFGGWVVDTPGVRQLQLWDIVPAEIQGFFPEFRPFATLCDFPDCTHTHETGCAVKEAVSRHQISARRYHSYLGMFQGTLRD